VARRLDPAAAQSLPLPTVSFNEAAFRYALNEDAMGTEKLAEGIRSFAADAAKLDRMIEGLAR
jgi:transaldolase